MNRGIAQLSKAVEEAQGNQSEIARRLEFDQSYVNKVLHGRETSLEFRKRCKERLGISLDAWDEPAPEAS